MTSPVYDWQRISVSEDAPIGYRNGVLSVEDVHLPQILSKLGTPVYIYSSLAIEQAYLRFQKAFTGLTTNFCYALKANGTLAVVATLARLGAGADVVSQGELLRALAGGIPADRIVFSGVGKTVAEIECALKHQILQINVESIPELETLHDVAKTLGCIANIGIRVNPHIESQTHTKISTGRRQDKFGIDKEVLCHVFALAQERPFVRIRGLAVHIGSQITHLEPFENAFSTIAETITILRNKGYIIDRIDLGGGLGIEYEQDVLLTVEQYAQIVRTTLAHKGCEIVLEPGRALVGMAGILVAQVVYVKVQSGKCFVILDAAMNDLLRPSLYNAYHPIIPVHTVQSGTPVSPVDVVGCICESGDTFAFDRYMPTLSAGDWVAILACGAYGAVMSSEYNGRPRPAEVLVKGQQISIARPRSKPEHLFQQEVIPEWLN